MQIFLSPHNDDEALFGAYTIMREKPMVVVVTHSTLQGNNGHKRAMESYKAMKVLEAPVCFLGIDEDKLTEDTLYKKLLTFPFDTFYYIPEYERDGNPHHNIVHETVRRMTDNYTVYQTYSGLEDRAMGREIVPTEKELELKKKAMACYKTQIENPNTAHYFETYAEYV